MDGSLSYRGAIRAGAVVLLVLSTSASARTGEAHIPDRAPTADAAPPPVERTRPSRGEAAAGSEMSWTRFERIGLSVDYFSESSRLVGEQWINNFRDDESFDYGGGDFAFSLYALVHPAKHWRVGPSIRFLGTHGNEQFTFGHLSEAALQGEFSMRAFEKVDAVLGARAGLSLMFPSRSLSEEIRRLRAEGAGVWDVPRFGLVGGVTLGARRPLLGRLYGRLDFNAQLAHQWLFSTDQVVDGLRFQKLWNAQTQRLGATLSAEVCF